MKKTISILLVLALTVTFAFALVGCKNKTESPNTTETPSTTEKPGTTEKTNTTEKPGTPAEKKYTIRFDSKGGNAVAEISASAGAEIAVPEDPTKNGFEFLGWFESADGGETLADTAFTFAYMPAKNITLYAKWAAVSEIGKKYAVKDYKTDVIFAYDDPAKAPEDEELDNFKKAYSTMWLLFKENHAVEIYLPGGRPEDKDDTHFYAITSENCVAFFDSEEDAENLTNRQTADYLGGNYQFDSRKKTLTFTIRNDEEMITLTMILHCDK